MNDANFIVAYLQVRMYLPGFVFEYDTVVSRFPPKLRAYEDGIEWLIAFHSL